MCTRILNSQKEAVLLYLEVYHPVVGKLTLYCCVLNLLSFVLLGLLGDIKILLSTLKYNETKNNQLNEFEIQKV